jgi:hypothetical protein
MKIKVYVIEVGIPAWLKKSLVYVGIPGALIFGAIAGVRAAVSWQDTSVIEKGKPIPSSVIKGNFDWLKNSFDSLQTSVSTAQSGLNGLQARVASGDGVKASSLVCAGCTPPSSTTVAGRVLITPRRSERVVTVAANSSSGWITTDTCADDEVVIGGGCSIQNVGPNVNAGVTSSFAGTNHWSCAVKNNESFGVSLFAIVVCGKANLVFED